MARTTKIKRKVLLAAQHGPKSRKMQGKPGFAVFLHSALLSRLTPAPPRHFPGLQEPGTPSCPLLSRKVHLSCGSCLTHLSELRCFHSKSETGKALPLPSHCPGIFLRKVQIAFLEILFCSAKNEETWEILFLEFFLVILDSCVDLDELPTLRP